MKYSDSRLARQLAPALEKLWNDSVDHGPQAAPLLPENVADALATLSAVTSLVTLIVSATYAVWALVQYLKARKQEDVQ